MNTRENIVKFLLERADFWDKFVAHKNTAHILRNEAALIKLGRHEPEAEATAPQTAL